MHTLLWIVGGLGAFVLAMLGVYIVVRVSALAVRKTFEEAKDK
jgi:hypothetical protein